MNTKKKKYKKKRQRQKEELTSVSRPLSWNIPPQIGLMRCVYTTACIPTNNFLYKNYPKTLNVHIVFPALDILG
jgi:hypothetical protein